MCRIPAARIFATTHPDALAPLVHKYRRKVPRGERHMASNTSVMGIYTDRATVSEAVNVMVKAGYRAADISVMESENQGSKAFAHVKHNMALHGAAIGAAAGAVAGAALGWFISTQPVTITALAPLAAAGPLIAAIAGAGTGGALGWIVGFLLGLLQTEYVAKRYAGRIRHGGILMSVHCDSREWCDRARKTLKDTGARDISATAESAADYGTTDRPTKRATAVVPVRVEPLVLPATVQVEAPVVLTTDYVPLEIKK
jgi:hypothetical protein